MPALSSLRRPGQPPTHWSQRYTTPSLLSIIFLIDCILLSQERLIPSFSPHPLSITFLFLFVGDWEEGITILSCCLFNCFFLGFWRQILPQPRITFTLSYFKRKIICIFVIVYSFVQHLTQVKTVIYHQYLFLKTMKTYQTHQQVNKTM